MPLSGPLQGLDKALRTFRPQRGALDNAREAVDRDRISAGQRRAAATAAAAPPSFGSSVQLAGMSEGLVLSDEERARVCDVRPAEGFAEVAGDALQLLQQRHGLDLWMVTRVRDGAQSVVVARGVVGMPVPADAVQPWAQSYCRLMVAGGAPRVAPRAADVPAYASAKATARFGIAAYIGVPLLATDGTLFGTLCALSATEQPESLRDALPDVELVARLLSTVLAKEAAALERSYEAAQAYARADRDQLTGLLNPRGWQARLLVEEERCRRHGRSASVLAIDLDDLRRVNVELGAGSGDHVLRTAADVLLRGCRSIDVVARTGGDEFAVLLAESGLAQARGLAARLQRALLIEGVRASTAASARTDAL
ncbi:MAG: histidine kinase, partial [Frankiales bacterium]|nr:histidine kinase [Frankiales bacterium]